MGTRRLLTLSALLAALLLASPAAFAHEGHHHGETEAAATWKCPSCGYASNTGNFCSKCGTAKPGTWTCNACGHRGNTGKFCSNCGTAKPDPNAPVAQASSAPADNGLCINVLRTNGSVDQYKLVNMPGITFSGNRISVGGVSYEKSKVQRLEYGKSSSSTKTSDKPADQQNAVYFYRRDGKFNAFEQTAIKSMSHDIADTLQVALADSVYKIPIAAIDSIGIHPFPTVYNPRVVRLAPYIPYVESVSVENQSIKFKKNLPDEMKPKQGDILFYETFDTTFPDGFAGRVVTTDGYACSTEMVGIDDIYERVMMFGTLSVSDDLYASESGSSHLPAPDDEKKEPKTGVSIDLKEMKISVSYGGVSASFKEDVSPIFSVSTVKRSALEKAITVVSVGLSNSFEVAVSVSGSKSTRRYNGKTLSPMAKVAIPACPVFSVGLDIFPFVEASIKGTLGVSGKADASFYTTLIYCDDDLSVEGVHFSADFSVGDPDVKAEGKLSAGVSIYPSIQMTGGALKFGPVFEIGPSLTATLKLDAAGAVNCAYDVIKDSKVTASLEGKVRARLTVLKKEFEIDSISFPFTLCERDWYFVPLFSKPTVSPTRTENVGVSTTASRPVLGSRSIGIDILRGGNRVKTYAHDEAFSADPVIMSQHFSGFEENVTYTAVPTLEIFGQHVQASPRTDFTVKDNVPEVRTEDAYNVMSNSATIEGSFPDYDKKYSEYGLQYAAEGETTWHKKKNPKLNEESFFRANLSDLKQNTIYRFQAYLICDGQTYYGEEKTFLTGLALPPLEVKNPGGYRIEWRDYHFSHYDDVDEIHCDYGAYERRGFIRTEYEMVDGKLAPIWRYNDSSRTTAYYNPQNGKWEDPIYDEERYPTKVEEGRKERKELAAKYGYKCFDDDFGSMAYYAEGFTRMLCQSGFDEKRRKSLMDGCFVGKDTVCGVECNVYHGVWNYPGTTWWIDPQTGLLLRVESDCDIFEVTRYEIDGYQFKK